MKAQVLTTTRSARSGASAGTRPSASMVPVSLSESTWFFGQPSVSTQKERDIGARLLSAAADPAIGWHAHRQRQGTTQPVFTAGVPLTCRQSGRQGSSSKRYDPSSWLIVATR